MEVTASSATTKGPESMFTGDVFFDVIIGAGQLPHARVISVHFTPGARTAWHMHVVGQALHVTEGIGLIQTRGGEVKVMRAGDTVFTPAGEWHWHGAAGSNFMTHLAIWEVPDSGPDGEWGDLVSDEEYNQHTL